MTEYVLGCFKILWKIKAMLYVMVIASRVLLDKIPNKTEPD